MNRRSVYMVIALALLIAYYFGLAQVRVSEEWRLIFTSLVFLGYFILGVFFGFLFKQKMWADFALVFALGFLGSMISIVLSYKLISPDVIFASFFTGITTAAGTLVNALLVKVWRWRSSKKPRKRSSKN